MNCVQLLLLFLISTFQITPIKCVTRFKMKSCVKTRNVIFVVETDFEEGFDTSRYSYHDEIFYYRQLKYYIKKHNDNGSCFKISLTIITPHDILKMADDIDIDYLKYLDRPRKLIASWKYFLDQYEKQIDNREDNLLVLFLSTNTKNLTKELNKIRKISRVVITVRFHLLFPKVVSIEEPLDFSRREIVLKRRIYPSILPLLKLIQNPEFDQSRFIEELPYEKDITCLRNTTVVWIVGSGLHNLNDERSVYQHALLYEYFLAFSKKLNVKVYTLRASSGRVETSPNMHSSIIYRDELLTDILGINSTTISRDQSYCKGGKVVYIIDTSSIRSMSIREMIESLYRDKCFVQLHLQYRNYDQLSRYGHVITYSGVESNPYRNVDLLFDVLMDIGCKTNP